MKAIFNLHRKLNCNKTRRARPKKGSMKDRDNSEQSGGEDEDCFVKTTNNNNNVSDKNAVDLLLCFAKGSC